jgi:hypothetical protein
VNKRGKRQPDGLLKLDPCRGLDLAPKKSEQH